MFYGSDASIAMIVNHGGRAKAGGENECFFTN